MNAAPAPPAPVTSVKRRPGRPPTYVFDRPDEELTENERRLRSAVLKRRERQNRSYRRRKAQKSQQAALRAAAQSGSATATTAAASVAMTPTGSPNVPLPVHHAHVQAHPQHPALPPRSISRVQPPPPPPLGMYDAATLAAPPPPLAHHPETSRPIYLPRLQTTPTFNPPRLPSAVPLPPPSMPIPPPPYETSTGLPSVTSGISNVQSVGAGVPNVTPYAFEVTAGGPTTSSAGASGNGTSGGSAAVGTPSTGLPSSVGSAAVGVSVQGTKQETAAVTTGTLFSGPIRASDEAPLHDSLSLPFPGESGNNSGGSHTTGGWTAKYDNCAPGLSTLVGERQAAEPSHVQM